MCFSMKKLMDRLLNSCGIFGYFLFYGLLLIFAFLPLPAIGVPLWLHFIIVPLALMFAEIYVLVSPVFWIWGFVSTIQGEQDAFAVIYYICFAVYAILFIPGIIDVIRDFSTTGVFHRVHKESDKNKEESTVSESACEEQNPFDIEIDVEDNTPKTEPKKSNYHATTKGKPYLYGRVFGKGPNAEYTNKLRKTNSFLIVLCFILAISSVALSFSLSNHMENESHLETLLKNEIQANKNLRDKQEDENSLSAKLYSTKSKLAVAEEKSDFLDEHIAFVVYGDERYYHKYDCTAFQNCNTYWAYNIEQAEDNGYRPCPDCH